MYINGQITFSKTSGRYGSSYCRDFWVGKGYLAVVTVKPLDTRVDPDVIVSEYNGNWSQTSRGSHKELVLFGNYDKENWYNIVVSDYSGKGGRVAVTIHRVNVNEVIAEGLASAAFQYIGEEILCQMFTGKGCESVSSGSSDMVGRAVTFGLSKLQDQNLEQMTRAAIISEITYAVRRETGLPRGLGIVAAGITTTALNKILYFY